MKTSENASASCPLGAAIRHGGANFSVFSRHASKVELLFFDRTEDAHPSRVIAIDPLTNRTYHYWHVYVPGVQSGQIYGYRTFMDLAIPLEGCGLIPPKSCLTHMAAGWLSRGAIAAMRPLQWATMPQWP